MPAPSSCAYTHTESRWLSFGRQLLGVIFCLVAALFQMTAVAAECAKLTEVCVDGPSTKLISGHPVYRDCWKYEVRYTCLAPDMNTAECDELRARGCGQISSTCVESSDSGCTLFENKFRCEVTPTQIGKVADCGTQSFCLDGNCFDASYPNDADFAKVVAYMEAVREAGMYMDEDNLTMFNGKAGTCSLKFLGLANCCKAKSAGAPSNSLAMKAIAEGLGFGYDYARSTYMYDVLFRNDAPDWVMKALYGTDAGMSLSPSFSYYGFTAGLGTPLGPGAIKLIDTGSFVVGFDPMSFAISIAIQFVMDALLSCDESDKMVAMRKSSRLCTYLGSYCSKKFLGACLNKKESYCCFNSRLARIINEQGRGQIGKSFGSAKAPNCTGFTPQELQSLDFSRMDLSEFYSEIQAKTLDTAAIQTAIKNRVVSDPMKSYYRGTRP